MERWSNASALGFAIAGAGAAGFSDVEISRLVQAMEAAFENMTVEEAGNYYRHGDY